MKTYIDRNAGFAAFIRGRSHCVRLDGTLDRAMGRAVADRVRADRESVRLRLECSTLGRVEPEAASVLARALLAWSRGRPDRVIDVLNLDPELARRVAWHPLRSVLDPDELVFLDPDRDAPWETFASRR